MIEIKSPTVLDAPVISCLLNSLGYPTTESLIEKRISQFLQQADELLLVAYDAGEILGVISLHFIPQLALSRDFCRISYFCVAETSRNKGIGALLESKAVEVAKERNCECIELHCHSRRTDAHRFYHRQGYVESPKYLIKKI
ncbi:MAG TPA: GNAT family N-acetyltransferase [Sulfurospirillum sp. UBA11407]|jgi:GNAT superfamily N-acetyltransferase|nr:MAG TPA: GNAT family N-acetyltransferase [Sulfurospirillum sp. UBA11407]